MGPQDLVVVYVSLYIVSKIYEAIYGVVEDEFIREARLQAGLRERQNLVEVLPGDAQVSNG
jgi:hypothetical protein